MVKKIVFTLTFFFIFICSVNAASSTNIGYWTDYVDYGQFWFNPIPESGDRYIILQEYDFVGNHTFGISNIYSMDLYLHNIPSQLQVQGGLLYELEFSMPNAHFQNINQVLVRPSDNSMQCSVTSFDNSNNAYPKIRFTCPSSYSSLQISIYSSSLQNILTSTSLRLNYLYLRQYESSGTDTSVLEGQNQIIINQNDTIINNQNSNTNSIINNQNSNTNTITQNQNQNSQNIINNQNSNTNTITQNQNSNTNSIINNQNSNTDTIVDNQNENTDTIVDNQNQNTDTIVDNQNQNTQDIINRQDETFGNFCYTNLLDINSNYIKRNNNGSMTISGNTITLTNSSSTNNAYGWIIPVEPNKKVTISMEDIVPNVTFANVYYRFLESPITSIPDFSNSEPLSKTSKTTTVTTTTNYLLVYIRVPQTTFNVTGLMVTYSEQKLAYVSYGENKCINKLDEQTNAINNLNDTLNSDDTPDTEDQISDLNDSLISDTPITDLITLPISLLNSYISGFSGSCSPYNLGNLYGTNLILPCINLQQYLGSNLWTIIDGLFAIFMIYNIAMLMIQAFEGFTSLRDDYEGLYQPRHADTGYQAKHGGGN